MKYLILFFLIALIGGCSKSNDKIKEATIEVRPSVSHSSLFYVGHIEPLKTTVVSSRVEGIILEMSHHFGEHVKKGELLFKISSSKFSTTFKGSLMDYVKAKNEFNRSQIQLSETKFLFDHGLISKDEFKTKQSNLYASELSLLQSKDVLQKLIMQLNLKKSAFLNLTIADTNKIDQIIHSTFDSEKIIIHSPADGVLLSPNKNEDRSKKMMIGDMIKEGDALAMIGDMHGISIKINVSELSLNQLKLNQLVKITGVAFPNHILKGFIKQIDQQGEININGLPTFAVKIDVPKLNYEEEKLIHVGMSAKVEIEFQEDETISIPFAALTEENGHFFVMVLNQKTKQKNKKEIKMGKTTLNEAQVLSGLKGGEQLVLINRA